MKFGATGRAMVVASAMSILAIPVPSFAQDGNEEARIRRLEAEVRALQRKVFPGGDGKFFEPEITRQPGHTVTVTPSTTAVTDILARLDALEAQLQRQTALNEESGNLVRLLTERVELLETRGASMPAVADEPVSRPVAAPATPAPARPAAVEPAPVTGPDAERLAAVQAIAKPQTEDSGDDEYSYGYRLWNAGFYPEAQQQLTMMIERYPDHPRTSYSRNLLGRAYLDDGKAREAAPWFLQNYQADKNGARAGDSLLYLAEAMIALKDTKRACIALAEFAETYAALAAGRLQTQYEANRGKVKCD